MENSSPLKVGESSPNPRDTGLQEEDEDDQPARYADFEGHEGLYNSCYRVS